MDKRQLVKACQELQFLKQFGEWRHDKIPQIFYDILEDKNSIILHDDWLTNLISEIKMEAVALVAESADVLCNSNDQLWKS